MREGVKEAVVWFEYRLNQTLFRTRWAGRVFRQGRLQNSFEANKCWSWPGSKQESAQEDGGEDYLYQKPADDDDDWCWLVSIDHLFRLAASSEIP